ncbi:MAG: 3-keto-disaccharide hydrolase [Bacteroidota bacterium]
MKKQHIVLTSLLLSFFLLAFAGEDGWKSLFNGKDLDGWVQKNGWATYRVEDGMIIGRTARLSPNSFLCTTEEYGDFELVFEVKLLDNELNSGVQIRSKTSEAGLFEKSGRVNGPQVEIEASGDDGAEAGYLYAEAAGGWMTPDDKRVPHKTFKDGEWNKYRVVAKGPRIQVWINGKKISDLVDEDIYESHPKGFIGLQVHSVGFGGPYEVAWRNIEIRELD